MTRLGLPCTSLDKAGVLEGLKHKGRPSLCSSKPAVAPATGQISLCQSPSAAMGLCHRLATQQATSSGCSGSQTADLQGEQLGCGICVETGGGVPPALLGPAQGIGKVPSLPRTAR